MTGHWQILENLEVHPSSVGFLIILDHWASWSVADRLYKPFECWRCTKWEKSWGTNVEETMFLIVFYSYLIFYILKCLFRKANKCRPSQFPAFCPLIHVVFSSINFCLTNNCATVINYKYFVSYYRTEQKSETPSHSLPTSLREGLLLRGILISQSKHVSDVISSLIISTTVTEVN